MSIGDTVLAVRERRRKREAAMKLGSELVRPEVLDTISDPAYRKQFEAVGNRMAAGDMFVDDAVEFLKAVPQPPEATTVDPAVLEMVRGQMPGGGQPAAAGAVSDTVPPELSQPSSAPASGRVDSPQAYVDSLNVPMGRRGSIDLKMPKPRNVVEREQADVMALENQKNEAAIKQKQLESGVKLGTAVRRLAVLNRQFKAALPSKGRSSLGQRFVGGFAEIGAKTGIAPNAKLLALQKNVAPMAINLIKTFGEAGNLAEQEQARAIEMISNAKLTDAERIAQVQQFAEFALAGADPEVKEYLRSQTDIAEILDYFGISLDVTPSQKKASASAQSKRDFTSEAEVEKANLPDGTRITVNGKPAIWRAKKNAR